MGSPMRYQPQLLIRPNQSNPYGCRLHWAATASAFLNNPPLTNRPASMGFGSFGIATNGGNNGQITTTAAAPALLGRANGTADGVNLTVIIVATDVGNNSWIYDGQESGGTGYIKKDASGNLQYNDGTGYTVGAAWPTTAKICIFHNGKYGGSIQPQVWFDGVPVATTNSTPGDMGHYFNTPPFRGFFGSTPFPTSNKFIGKGYLVAILRGLVTQEDVNALTANPWQVFDASDNEDFLVAAGASAPTSSTGTFAATLAAPSMTSAGLVTVPGTLAASMAAPTFAASGIAATPPSGTFAASMPAPVMTSAGIALDAGQFSATMPAPTFAAIGTAAPNVTGALAFTMPAPTMSAFGFLGGSAPAAPVRPYRWRILRRGFAST